MPYSSGRGDRGSPESVGRMACLRAVRAEDASRVYSGAHLREAARAGRPQREAPAGAAAAPAPAAATPRTTSRRRRRRCPCRAPRASRAPLTCAWAPAAETSSAPAGQGLAVARATRWGSRRALHQRRVLLQLRVDPEQRDNLHPLGLLLRLLLLELPQRVGDQIMVAALHTQLVHVNHLHRALPQ
eukprot:275234-Prymnesium_polylepis.1